MNKGIADLSHHLVNVAQSCFGPPQCCSLEDAQDLCYVTEEKAKEGSDRGTWKEVIEGREDSKEGRKEVKERKTKKSRKEKKWKS